VFIFFHIKDVILVLLNEAIHLRCPKERAQGGTHLPARKCSMYVLMPWLAEARKQALLNTHDSDRLGLAIEARAMT
jgi:hypothetical protein